MRKRELIKCLNNFNTYVIFIDLTGTNQYSKTYSIMYLLF